MSAYLSPLHWIRLAKYCELSRDTADAVHARRRKRQWTDGLHCRLGPDGNLWVNLEEVNKWVEGQDPRASSSIRAA
ncbi:excisionase [Methylibium sp.]|uniref:excisionase n=1 Tax=Methylibium sp. TaxID=2067992 RepID=UPI00334036B9